MEVPQGKGNQNPSGVSKSKMNSRSRLPGAAGTRCVRLAIAQSSSGRICSKGGCFNRLSHSSGLRKNMKYRANRSCKPALLAS